MLPLIRMAWTINRRLLIQFSPFLGFYLWGLVAAQSESATMPRPFIAAFLMIIAMATAIITFQGLTLPVEGFLLSLPVARAQIVRTKYLTSFLGLMAGVALPMATSWMAHFMAPGLVPAPSSEALGIVGIWTLFLSVGILLFLPFVYHFGPSKGFMIFAITVILIPSGGLALEGVNKSMDILATFLNRLLDQPNFAATTSMGVLLFGLASMGLSTWSYRSRAF